MGYCIHDNGDEILSLPEAGTRLEKLIVEATKEAPETKKSL
jgi:hypothetical protein